MVFLTERLPPSMRNTIFRNIDARIAVSRSTAEAFKKRLNDGAEYIIIYNGVNTDDFSPEGPIIKEWIEEDGKDIILFAPGRLEPRKGGKTAIESYVVIKRERPNVKLIIVGGGPDEKDLKHMVSSKKIPDVKFVPRLPRHGDINYDMALRTVKLCLCTPKGGEGFGRVVIEPLVRGTPVVASDIPGYNEAADGGKHPFAVLAQPQNLEDIAKKAIGIIDWTEEMRQKLKWEAYNYVDRRFGWPIVTDQMEDFLNDSDNRHGGVHWTERE